MAARPGLALFPAVSEYKFPGLLTVERHVVGRRPIPSNSDTHESTLYAGMIKYVSSANLHIALPAVATVKSSAVTTDDAGRM